MPGYTELYWKKRAGPRIGFKWHRGPQSSLVPLFWMFLPVKGGWVDLLKANVRLQL